MMAEVRERGLWRWEMKREKRNKKLMVSQCLVCLFLTVSSPLHLSFHDLHRCIEYLNLWASVHLIWIPNLWGKFCDAINIKRVAMLERGALTWGAALKMSCRTPGFLNQMLSVLQMLKLCIYFVEIPQQESFWWMSTIRMTFFFEKKERVPLESVNLNQSN